MTKEISLSCTFQSAAHTNTFHKLLIKRQVQMSVSVIYRKKVCKSWKDFYTDQIIEMIWYPIQINQISIFFALAEVLKQETNKHKIRLFASHVTATFVCGYCCHVCGLYLFPSGKKIEILPFFQRITITTFNIATMAQEFQSHNYHTFVTFRQGDKKINSI